MKHVTDLKIMDAVLKECYFEFKKDNTKYYAVFDLRKVSKKLNIDYGILWGRFYYHLNKKYKGNIEKSELFYPFEGENRDLCSIHFPLLSSIVADKRDEYFRFTVPLYLSVGFSVLSLVLSILK
jgi:hypothetical protein